MKPKVGDFAITTKPGEVPVGTVGTIVGRLDDVYYVDRLDLSKPDPDVYGVFQRLGGTIFCLDKSEFKLIPVKELPLYLGRYSRLDEAIAEKLQGATP